MPKVSNPSSRFSAEAKMREGSTIGRVTSSSTRHMPAPEARAASSRSDGRLRIAEATYRYTLGT
jgi:hypothetical protein